MWIIQQIESSTPSNQSDPKLLKKIDEVIHLLTINAHEYHAIWGSHC